MKKSKNKLKKGDGEKYENLIFMKIEKSSFFLYFCEGNGPKRIYGRQIRSKSEDFRDFCFIMIVNF